VGRSIGRKEWEYGCETFGNLAVGEKKAREDCFTVLRKKTAWCCKNLESILGRRELWGLLALLEEKGANSLYGEVTIDQALLGLPGVSRRITR